MVNYPPQLSPNRAPTKGETSFNTGKHLFPQMHLPRTWKFLVIKSLSCLWWPIPRIWRFGPVSLVCIDQKNELVPSLLLKPVSPAMHMPTRGLYCCLVPSPIIPEHLQILRVSLTHPSTMLLHMSTQIWELYCVQICLSIHTCKSIVVNAISPCVP